MSGNPRFCARLLCVCLAASTALAGKYAITTVAGGVPPLSGMAARDASIGDPPRVAVDAAGNVYFGSLHSVFRVDLAGRLLLVAGTGRPGTSGDGGPALEAQLFTPDGIAVDGSGNVYVADRAAHTVRRIGANGTIGLYAGNGTAGYSGDGGPAAQAQLDTPCGLALDAAGNLYIADRNNHRIRVVSPEGVIRTIAGSGSPGYAGDNGPASAAALYYPSGVVVDGATLYVADTQNYRVRAVEADGSIHTVAGDGDGNTFGDGGAATETGVVLPTAVAVDGQHRLYIADFGNSRIRVVTAGAIETIAGGTSTALIADHVQATSIRLTGPTGVAVDAQGNVYIAEGSVGSGTGLAHGDFRIWKVDSDGMLSAAAGTGIASYSGDGGSAATAQLSAPSAVAADRNGNLYIADTANNRVRLVDASGMMTTIAGNGVAGFSGDGGPATSAQLNGPMGVAVDDAGNVFIADTGNSRIRRVAADGTIDTYLGNGNASYFGDGMRARLASVNHPQGVAVDPQGVVYVADTRNNVIRRVAADGIAQTLVGSGPAGLAGDGGPAADALLSGPAGVAVDAAGNLYIADAGNGSVRRVSTDGTISTVTRDLANPHAIAVDSAGDVFVTLGDHREVLRVPAGGEPEVIAGSGDCCYTGDGGPATDARLDNPWGLAVGVGGIYVADQDANAVRLLIPTGDLPSLSAVVNGASNAAGPVAPGEVVVLFGTGLGPARLTQSTEAGTRVLFNGTPGTLLYTSALQVSAVAPASLTGPAVQIAVEYQSLKTEPVTLPVAQAAPALFTLDATGKGQAVALNEDGSVNGAGNAASGSVTLYANGLVAGVVPQVRIGGYDAAVLSVEAAAPVWQIVVRPVRGLGGSALPVQLLEFGASSQSGVTVALTGN